MTKSRPQAHSERQDQIARAAAEIIGSRGIRRTNLRDIARHMGVTTGTIQHYFDNKEDLLQFTAYHCMDNLAETANRKSQNAEGIHRLRIFCELILPLTEERYEAWLVATALLGATIGDHELTELVIKRYKSFQEKFCSIIIQLKESGVINEDIDAKVVGYGMVAFVEGLGMQIVFSRQRHKSRYAKRLVADYLGKDAPSRAIAYPTFSLSYR